MIKAYSLLDLQERLYLLHRLTKSFWISDLQVQIIISRLLRISVRIVLVPGILTDVLGRVFVDLLTVFLSLILNDMRF